MFCPGDVISIEDIHGIEPPNLSSSPGQQSIVLVGDELEPYKIAKEKIIDSFTVEYIHSILKKHNGNISQAAATSGLSRVALQKIIKRHDIDADAFRS